MKAEYNTIVGKSPNGVEYPEMAYEYRYPGKQLDIDQLERQRKILRDGGLNWKKHIVL